MRSIIFDFEDNNSQNLYIQIFDQIKARILSGEFEAGMKLPSLRGLAKANDISVTTVETAYNQLLVEGYIESRPKSGYYVSDDISGDVGVVSQQRLHRNWRPDFIGSYLSCTCGTDNYEIGRASCRERV